MATFVSKAISLHRSSHSWSKNVVRAVAEATPIVTVMDKEQASIEQVRIVRSRNTCFGLWTNELPLLF